MSILYVGANNNMTMGLALAEINSDGRLAMDRIVRDVRWGTQVVLNYPLTGTPLYTTDDDELIIQIPSIDTNGDVIANTYDYVIYALDPALNPEDPTDTTTIKKLVYPDDLSNRSNLDQVIADNINSFALSFGGTALGSVGSLSSVQYLEIALIVDKQVLLNQNVTETINSVAELRNN